MLVSSQPNRAKFCKSLQESPKFPPKNSSFTIPTNQNQHIHVSTNNKVKCRCELEIGDQQINEAKISRKHFQPIDVDQELWKTLELCEDEELCAVYNVLQEDSWFSPLGKRIFSENEPAALSFRGRNALMRRIEKQFRFLAADSFSMIRGVRPSYRQTLVSLTQYLKIDCPSDLATPDLESEIFLYVLEKCQGVLDQLQETHPEQLASYVQPNFPKRTVENIGSAIEQVMAPLRLGSKEVGQTVAKLGGVFAVQKFSGAALSKLAAQVLSKNGQYQAALKTLLSAVGRKSTGKAISIAAVQSAQKGVTSAAARYSATRGALSLLGPLLWVWMGVDLTLLSLGTDYARVIRAVCLLAQVRLLRTKGWLAAEWQ